MAGKKYYMEILGYEINGGDIFKAGAVFPGGELVVPITYQYLEPYRWNRFYFDRMIKLHKIEFREPRKHIAKSFGFNFTGERCFEKFRMDLISRIVKSRI